MGKQCRLNFFSWIACDHSPAAGGASVSIVSSSSSLFSEALVATDSTLSFFSVPKKKD